MTADPMQRERALFAEALECEPAEREEVVRRGAAGDQALCERVLALLAAHERAAADPSVLSPPQSPPVEPPERIGNFRIVREIGGGGMGVVFLAEQTAPVRRRVAIKLIKDGRDSDEVIARFQSERQALALMNHPNIAQILDAGATVDGRPYFVMELVPGVPITEYCDGKELSIEARLRLLLRVARAVEHAHKRGVIHRDLKPSNVLVAEDDGEPTPKIIDFGIAKAIDERFTDGMITTGHGRLIGTPDYMSPEQVRSEPADRRSDIWAFGCLVYRLLAGQGPFTRATVADTLAAVVDREPEWEALPAIDPILLRLIRRCLRKPRRQRLHDMADVRLEIEEALADPEASARLFAGESSPQGLISRAAPLIAGLVVLAAAVFLGRELWYRPGAPELRVAGLPLPRGAVLPGTPTPAFAISPDGRKLVYVVAGEGMVVRHLDGLDSTPIGEGEQPFFSSDGEWIGFTRGDGERETGLWKVRATGGAPVLVATVDSVRGAAWHDDSIVFGSSIAGLARVPANGGDPRPLTRLDVDAGETAHKFPHWLPGGDAVLFSVHTGLFPEDVRIELVEVDGGSRRALIDDGTQPRLAASGHLLFARVPSLMAAPFDVDTLQVTGSPLPVVDALRIELPGAGTAHYDISTGGTLVYEPPVPVLPADLEVVLVDREGYAESLGVPLGPYHRPRFSSDGSRIGMERFEGVEIQVVVWDRPGARLTQLTTAGRNGSVVWMAGDSSIAFFSDRRTGRNVWSRPLLGGDARQLTVGANELPHDASADGAYLLLDGTGPANDWDISLYSVADGTITVLIDGPEDEFNPRFSPDDRWIVYQSDVLGGADEIFIAPVADPGRRLQVSSGGGAEPRWSADGTEIFYLAGTPPQVMAVPVVTEPGATEPDVKVGRPRALFGAADYFTAGDTWDVDPAGDGFVMLRRTSPPPGRDRLVIALNWLQELTRLLPTE